jgi:hypothetical protein
VIAQGFAMMALRGDIVENGDERELENVRVGLVLGWSDDRSRVYLLGEGAPEEVDPRDVLSWEPVLPQVDPAVVQESVLKVLAAMNRAQQQPASGIAIPQVRLGSSGRGRSVPT